MAPLLTGVERHSYLGDAWAGTLPIQIKSVTFGDADHVVAPHEPARASAGPALRQTLVG